MNFFERYCGLCRDEGSSPNGVAKKLGIASASVTQWKQGSLPRVETLARIAEYFGVTVDYLTGKSDSREKPALQAENGLDEEFIRSYSRLNETNKAQIDSLIQFLLSQQGQ